MRRSSALLSLATALTLTATAPAVAAPAAVPAWHQTSSQTFYLLDALQRSQGVTTDGQSWFFSWQYGLSRVSLDGRTTIASNPLAIPSQISQQGGNHIGDIDEYNGTIYAPIEDGSAYRHPYIALYNAATLAFTGTAYALPAQLQPGGVPWVAVDPGRGYIYTSEWDPTTSLNVYSLADMHLVKTVPLSPAIGRIQGAKVYQGMLYASSDNATQSVYRIDPDTGAVTDVLDRDLPSGTEAEGLAFLPAADGSVMHTLDVAPSRLSVNFRSYGTP
jgi:glutamine cyclotransferase